MNIPEILSPAGSKEAFYAAIYQGCDAIYLGGKEFGARAYATNFEQDELQELITMAHLHGVKVYYTLNTLIKDIEIEQLTQVLDFLYSTSIDALIIQDIGVYELIKTKYPRFVIHGSTQMNLHQVDDVKMAKKLGFERVVLSRECSIEDIVMIKSQVDIEIETFVHGALCYCYSGLCLMSSIYGERSGNRGKCAQPCRLAYTVDNKAAFYLSPKDQMTLHQLPLLIEAGIDSFKIEGRMKSPEYVGLATHLYRKYRDYYMGLRTTQSQGTYTVDPMDIEKLNQLYNRGHFTPGYYEQHNNTTMISYDHSKHIGIKVGEMTYKKSFHFLFNTSIAKEDLLEIHLDQLNSDEQTWPEFFLNSDVKKGTYNQDALYNGNQDKVNNHLFTPHKTYPVYRIRQQQLNDVLSQEVKNLPRILIGVRIEARIDKQLKATILHIESRYRKIVTFSSTDELTVEGAIVQKSNNRPMVAEDFEKQLLKTKDTPFDIKYIDFALDESIFVPIKEINQVRRDIIDLLETYMLKQFSEFQINRNHSVGELHDLGLEGSDKREIDVRHEPVKGLQYPTHILISSLEQVEALIQFIHNETTMHTNIARIYIDAIDFTQFQLISSLAKLNQIRSSSSKSMNFDIYIGFPHVFFSQYQKTFIKKIFTLPSESLALIQGFLVRTLGEIEVIKSINQRNQWDKKLALDYTLNFFNGYSIKTFANDSDISTIAPSLELNGSGLRQLEKQASIPLEIAVYQRTALMHSANCIYKTSKKRCDFVENGHFLTLNDRKGMEQRVKTHCQVCYNTIYNEKPQFLMDVWKEELSHNAVMRLDFTCETSDEMKEILVLWKNTLMNQTNSFNDKRFTRGHYKRGVK